MISNHQIYTYIESKTNLTTRPVYCSDRYKVVPPSFPAAYITEIGVKDYTRSLTLKPQQCAKVVSWEVQVCSNKKTGAVDQAHKIIDDVDSAFHDLGFTQTSLMSIENTDPSIYRMVGRWERTLGSGDTIPTT